MRVFALAPASASVLMLVFSLLAGADSASAKPTDEQLAAIKANCRSDFMSNCWGVPRGGAEAFQCLKDHLASLSRPCQQAVKAVLAAAAPPFESGTPAAAAKPAGDTKPAAAAADSASPPGPAGTSNGATSGTAGQSSPAGSAATQATAAPAAAGQSTLATNANEGRTGAVPTQQSNAQAKKALSASSNGSSQSAIGAAAVNASEAAANSKSAATEATAPVTPATTGTARPPGIGFIPPRKKFMLARACRDDFNAHCPGVDLGQGRAISCLEANKASLTTDCRDALAKLMH